MSLSKLYLCLYQLDNFKYFFRGRGPQRQMTLDHKSYTVTLSGRMDVILMGRDGKRK